MAGAKDRSGGPRANAGGARPGAGRPKKIKVDDAAGPKKIKSSTSGAAVKVALEKQPHGGALKRSTAAPVEAPDLDMLQLLKEIALGRLDATANQVRAAVAAVQYTHTKKGDGGKKDEEAEKAKKAGAGKFAPAAPPKLVAAGGKKV